MVYARCTKCRCRYDRVSKGGEECRDRPGHKRYVVWIMDRQLPEKRVVMAFTTKGLATRMNLRKRPVLNINTDKGVL